MTQERLCLHAFPSKNSGTVEQCRQCDLAVERAAVCAGTAHLHVAGTAPKRPSSTGCGVRVPLTDITEQAHRCQCERNTCSWPILATSTRILWPRAQREHGLCHPWALRARRDMDPLHGHAFPPV